MKKTANLKGIGFLLLAMLIGSLQAVAVKWLGGKYSVLEIVTIRSLVALPITLLFFRLEDNKGLPTTKQPKLQFVRGIFLFLSYTTFMMGLAALPLADIEAIRFSGPMMITILSVFMLGEKVDLRRWLALIVGFAGILLIVQPGSMNFNEGSLFVLISVLFYALTVIYTRKMKTADSNATMAFSALFSKPSATRRPKQRKVKSPLMRSFCCSISFSVSGVLVSGCSCQPVGMATRNSSAVNGMSESCVLAASRSALNRASPAMRRCRICID